MGASAKIRVLFVCMGNICRSPSAEGVLRRLVAERGLDAEVEVDSAGTIGYHAGKPADLRARQAAERRGYNLTSRARQVTARDFDHYHRIVAMDRDNLGYLEDLAPNDAARAKLSLLSDYLPTGAAPDVPDPYYGGRDGFDAVLDLLEQACPRLLDELLGPVDRE